MPFKQSDDLTDAVSRQSGDVFIIGRIVGGVPYFMQMSLTELADELYAGSSTTSLAIGTGSKAFVIDAADKNFPVGSWVIAVSAANTANYLSGQVASYVGTTLTITVPTGGNGGSGTHADWDIYASGAIGPQGNPGVDGIDGIDGATWYSGSTDPSNGTGLNGDFYLQTGTGATGVVGDIWLKAAGSWAKTGGNIRGAPGTGDLTSTNNLSDLQHTYTGYDNISVHGADITSASTVNLETATGNLVDVTGTTTITAITLNEGHQRTVRFTGALTLTNGASLVLPGGQNIATAAGDYAIFRGYAAGVVRCVTYVKKNGATLQTGLATIASATTTDLGSDISHSVTVSGTTTITSFGSTAPTGALKHIEFSGALLLTHNATSLILPGAANITTVAGDCAIARHEGSGNWRVLTYLRASGRPLNSATTDVLTAGYTATAYNGGTVTGAGQTITPTPGTSVQNLQYYTLNGSSLTGTLTVNPPVGDCTVVFDLINGGTGAVGATLSTANWTKVTGDTYATTNGNKYRCYGSVINGVKHLQMQALQ